MHLPEMMYHIRQMVTNDDEKWREETKAVKNFSLDTSHHHHLGTLHFAILLEWTHLQYNGEQMYIEFCFTVFTVLLFPVLDQLLSVTSGM